MFSHVMLGANDIEASKKFYDATLGALGVKPGVFDYKGRVVYASPGGNFLISTPMNGALATCANGGTIGFAGTSPEAINAWHQAGVENGGSSCEEPPGLRDGGSGKLYLAYLRDPAGNKLCGLYQVPT